MKLENEFIVPAPVDQVWTILLDVKRIVPCVPGASIESQNTGEYSGTMKVKLGPMVNTFTGTLRLTEADEAQHRSVMRAQARAARGQGTASATITSTLAPADDTTHVTVQTELRVSGPLAQFGRGVMQDVSGKLMDQFAECLAAELAAPAPSAPAAPAAPAAPEAPNLDALGAPQDSAVAPPPSHHPDDVLDAFALGRTAVLRRAVAGVVAIAVLVLLLGRRRRRGLD